MNTFDDVVCLFSLAAEDGGAFSGPFERQSSPVSVLFVRTMWTLVISLLMLLVLLIVVLFTVCRHYR